MGQRIPCARVFVLAQPQKFVPADAAGQTQALRTDPEPFSGHPLSLVIVVSDAEVLLEIPLCVFQAVLCLGRDHFRILRRSFVSGAYPIRLLYPTL